MTRLALIGAGTMGAAMLERWLASGTLSSSEVMVVEKDIGRREAVSTKLQVGSAESLSGTETAKIYVLAVKPQDSGPVIQQLSGVVGDATVVTIMAGVPISVLRKSLGDSPSIVRVMPNVAATVGAAAMGYAIDPGPRGVDEIMIVELLSAVGVPARVPESLLDAVTAVSGSGPAYFFLLVEALTGAGVKVGLTREVARSLARQTMWGAACLLEQSGKEAEDLRASVTSKGGTTAAALEVLESSGIREIMDRAIKAARDRARELSKET
jgi:pyrroline-5-carboxylate reductase